MLRNINLASSFPGKQQSTPVGERYSMTRSERCKEKGRRKKDGKVVEMTTLLMVYSLGIIVQIYTPTDCQVHKALLYI